MQALIIKTLSLTSFKNYACCSLEFSDGINCLLGDNGSGKTNILDAIHYLGFSKSFFNHIDSQNIAHSEEFFILRGDFLCGNDADELSCAVRKGQRKILKRNKKEYERLADHIGIFPVVMISPDDIALVNDGSEMRRRFMDSVISQYSQDYLHDLITYNHALTQRNNLLRMLAVNRTSGDDVLEPWDMQLSEAGTRIHNERKKFIDSFIPTFGQWYGEVAGEREKPSLNYQGDLNHEEFSSILKRNREKDIAAQRTTAGTHKDDLEFQLDGFVLKKFGSQGQKKTYLIALKLAQFGFIAGAVKKLPILMLDDIFDKMDEKRAARLLQLMGNGRFGQVFITDTHNQRIPAMLNHAGLSYAAFNVQHGNVMADQQLAQASVA